MLITSSNYTKTHSILKKKMQQDQRLCEASGFGSMTWRVGGHFGD